MRKDYIRRFKSAMYKTIWKYKEYLHGVGDAETSLLLRIRNTWFK